MVLKEKLNSYLISQWENAMQTNKENILKLLDTNLHAKLIDLGCDNGEWTLRLANKIKTKYIYGIEICPNAAEKAKKKRIDVKVSDLNESFPYPDNFFDIVHANQVIEHITNIDGFVKEIYRILKPSGCAVISTENLSGIDNLVALALGQQGFSQHISEIYHVGNKFSPHFQENMDKKSWTHKIIFTYYGLQQLLNIYNFKIDKVLTSGFFPLPNLFSKIDPIHSHFLIVKARKIE